MQKTDCYGLISIGLCIRLLMNVNGEAKRNFVTSHFEILKKQLEKGGFLVSISGISAGLAPSVAALDVLKEDEAIGPDRAKAIVDSMMTFEVIVFAEAKTKSVYSVPARRYNAEYLLNTPENLFRTGVFGSLSDMAKLEIRSAGRCLLYGEATAAAFHILRGSEEVLRCFYFSRKKTKRLPTLIWGPMTSELRSLKRNRPADVILNSLDLVRNSYRNPTQHPDAVYDIETAQDLFGVCIDLINKMA